MIRETIERVEAREGRVVLVRVVGSKPEYRQEEMSPDEARTLIGKLYAAALEAEAMLHNNRHE